MNPNLYETIIKRVAESFKHLNGFASHNLESYEYFLHFMLPEIIEEFFPINVHCVELNVLHIVTLDAIHYQKPTKIEYDGFLKELSIKNAHASKQTYSFDVFVHVTHKIYQGTPSKFELISIRKFQNLLLCKIPCMTGSSMCYSYKNLDVPSREPGLFIINSYQKVIITQEHLRPNFAFIFALKNNAKYSLRCEFRAFHATKIRSTSTLNIFITTTKQGFVPCIEVFMPFTKKYVPLVVIFRIFGIHEVQDMIKIVLGNSYSEKLKFITESILNNDDSQTYNLQTQEALYDWVGENIATTQQKLDMVQQEKIYGETMDRLAKQEKKSKESEKKEHKDKLKRKRTQAAKNVFQNEFFPHCIGGDYSNTESANKLNKEKAKSLGYAIRKMLRVYIGEIPPDDIDNFINKRCCSAGILIALLFRQLMRIFTKTLHAQIFKKTTSCNYFVNIPNFFNLSKITSQLKYAFATGNWGAKKSQTYQNGVCQVLNDTNIVAKISHQRQINIPLNRDGKIAKLRQLHASHLGPLCAFETPEGKAVGLVHQLALFSRLRVSLPLHVIIFILISDFDIQNENNNQQTLIFLNGIMLGYTSNHVKFIEKFKKYRQDYTLPIDSSISFQENEINILTDAEGVYIPMLRIDKLHQLPILYQQYKDYLHIFWNQLLIQGVIEYIDKSEELNVIYATKYNEITPQSTHLMLDASKLLCGASAGIIPFSDHNQTPRNIYQAAMGKQAIGVQPLNFGDHLQSKTHILNYGQEPLVTTSTANYIDFELESNGKNVVVAIQIDTGYNQEDSLLIDQASVDLGMFRTTCFRLSREYESRHGCNEEKIMDKEMAEQESKNIKRKRKANFDKLEANGIVAPGAHINEHDVILNKYIKLGDSHIQDASITSKPNETCIIEQVSIAQTKDDLNCVTFISSSQRTPEVGDKFSSRHGQKGVCGNLTPHEDMPFTKDGIIANFVLNIHAIPSRMTIAQLIETYFGKIGAIEGKFIDGTPFRTFESEFLTLENIKKLAKDVMYSGITGERLTSKVCLGVTFYQRLKHMVQDKVHARRTGPNQILTRQPLGQKKKRKKKKKK